MRQSFFSNRHLRGGFKTQPLDDHKTQPLDDRRFHPIAGGFLTMTTAHNQTEPPVKIEF